MWLAYIAYIDQNRHVIALEPRLVQQRHCLLSPFDTVEFSRFSGTNSSALATDRAAVENNNGRFVFILPLRFAGNFIVWSQTLQTVRCRCLQIVGYALLHCQSSLNSKHQLSVGLCGVSVL